MSNGLNLCDTHKRPMAFLRKLYEQTHCPFGLKEAEKIWNDTVVRRTPCIYTSSKEKEWDHKTKNADGF